MHTIGYRLRHVAVWGGALAAVVLGCGGGPEKKESLTIAFSNDMLGEIRSCGCAAKDLGGLGRRASYVVTVRDSTENFLALEGGDFFGSELNYGKEKADLTLKAMAWMRYDGVVIGENEFGFGLDYIVKRPRELGVPVIVANLRDAKTDTLLFPPTRELTLPSGLRVGLIGVISRGLKFPPQVDADAIRIEEPISVVERYAKELEGRVDLIVVLAHMPRGLAQAIPQRVLAVDLVVSGHEGKPMRRIRRFGRAFVLQVADRGRYVGVAHAALNEERKISSLVTDVSPLTTAWEDHEAIAKLFRSYDLSVAAKEETNIPAAVFEARAGLKKPFAGSQACEDCHEDIYAQWLTTKHAHAIDVLKEQSRHYDRDCTPCHTTGFYRLGGFENIAVTPELVNVGCESCHGNGHDHVEDTDVPPDGDPVGACRECHTVDQTPDFDFDTYWDRIRHGGNGHGDSG